MVETAVPALILVVDDDVGLSRLIAKALDREGYTPITAASGRDAIAWLAQNTADLVLLDLKLQDIEGRDLIAILKEIGRLIPFIVITGQGDERVAVEMMRSGALDYLVKDTRFLDNIPGVVRRAMAQIGLKRQLELVEGQARLSQTIVDQTWNAVMVTSSDAIDPLILYINPAFAKLAKCPKETLIGQPLSVLESVMGPWRLFRSVLSTGRAFSGDMQLRDRNGEGKSFDCNITPVTHQNHTHTHWAVIMYDITDRKRLEREILEVSENELRRLGSDFHDGLGQQLTALELFAAGLLTLARKQAPRMVKPFQEMGSQLRLVVREARALSHGLAPVSLDGHGLVHALRELAGNTRTMSKVDSQFIGAPDIKVADATVATHLYRIAQEAVNNALKHSHAKKISLSLRQTGDTLKMTVSDNGLGINAAAKNAGGIGLHMMKYRADLIHATLEIAPAPKTGTQVICTYRPPS